MSAKVRTLSLIFVVTLSFLMGRSINRGPGGYAVIEVTAFPEPRVSNQTGELSSFDDLQYQFYTATFSVVFVNGPTQYGEVARCENDNIEEAYQCALKMAYAKAYEKFDQLRNNPVDHFITTVNVYYPRPPRGEDPRGDGVPVMETIGTVIR